MLNSLTYTCRGFEIFTNVCIVAADHRPLFTVKEKLIAVLITVFDAQSAVIRPLLIVASVGADNAFYSIHR